MIEPRTRPAAALARDAKASAEFAAMGPLSDVMAHFAARIAAKALPSIAIAVVDLGGAPLLLWRSEAIGFLYADLARAKAWTAAALRRTPTETGAALKENPAAAAYLAALGGGRFAPLPGGRLLHANSVPCGAVGAASPLGSAHDEGELNLVLQKTGLTA